MLGRWCNEQLFLSVQITNKLLFRKINCLSESKICVWYKNLIKARCHYEDRMLYTFDVKYINYCWCYCLLAFILFHRYQSVSYYNNHSNSRDNNTRSSTRNTTETTTTKCNHNNAFNLLITTTIFFIIFLFHETIEYYFIKKLTTIATFHNFAASNDPGSNCLMGV